MEILGMKPGHPWATLAGISEFGGGVLTALGLLNPLEPLGVMLASVKEAGSIRKKRRAVRVYSWPIEIVYAPCSACRLEPVTLTLHEPSKFGERGLAPTGGHKIP